MGFSIWHWFVVLLIIFLFTYPIFYPIYLWYVKKDRTSKHYVYARRCRIFLAILIALSSYKLITNIGNEDIFVLMGSITAKILMIYLLVKKWKPSESSL